MLKKPMRHKTRPKFLRCIAFGESGTGKTFFAGSFPEPYFIEFDIHGTQGIDSDKFPWLPEDFPVDTVRGVTEAIKHAEGLRDGGILVDPYGKGWDFKTIVTDPASKLWLFAQEATKKKKNKVDGAGDQKKPLSQLEWAECKASFNRYVIPISGANAHTVYTSKTTNDKDSNSKAGVSKDLYYEVDLVIEMMTKENCKASKKKWPCCIVHRDRTSSPWKEGSIVEDPKFSTWEPFLGGLNRKASTIIPTDPTAPTIKEKIDACLKDSVISKLAKQLKLDDAGLLKTIETYGGEVDVVRTRITEAAVKFCLDSDEVQALAEQLKLTSDQLDTSVRKYNGDIEVVIKQMKGALKK